MGKIDEILGKVNLGENLFDKLLKDDKKKHLIKELDKAQFKFSDGVSDFKADVLDRIKNQLKVIDKAMNTGDSEVMLRKNIKTAKVNIPVLIKDATSGLKKLEKLVADYESVLKKV